MNINNESIVYYAIRNKETDDYLLFEGGSYRFGNKMCFINYFFNFEDTQDFMNELVESHGDFKDKLEVRKMKIIDIT